MGPYGRQGGFEPRAAAESMWRAMDQALAGIEKRVNMRMGRGDVRASVLALLAEEPMHGYQIIREIEERTEGQWKPSAGSVYPTLQLLADEGLVVAENSNDRKIYSLTDEGRAEAESATASAPWADMPAREERNLSAIPKAGIELAQAAAQVLQSGTKAHQDETVKVLQEARRKIYTILAQD